MVPKLSATAMFREDCLVLSMAYVQLSMTEYSSLSGKLVEWEPEGPVRTSSGLAYPDSESHQDPPPADYGSPHSRSD